MTTPPNTPDDDPAAPAGVPVFDGRRRSRLFRMRVRDEVDTELAFHLEMRVHHHLALGCARPEAERRARAEFGDVDRVRQVCRTLGDEREAHMRLTQYLDEIRQDVTFALRQLRHAPGFTAATVLTLALGIGATTTIFSIVRGVLLAPLPYAQADRLVTARVSVPDYEDLQAHTSALVERSAIWASNLERLGDGSGDVERVVAAQVSNEFFSVLGVAPHLGRALDASDGATPVVVLSHSLWRRRFGADPAIVGRPIALGQRQVTVVGVMPHGFAYPSRAFDLWLPLEPALARMPGQREDRAFRIFTAVLRLRPERTPAELEPRVRALAATLADRYPDTNAGEGISLAPLGERLVRSARLPLLVLFGAVVLLLVIACANIATLLLARASVRAGEVALRAALGASRWRLVRQALTESVVLAIAGGLLGIAFAYGTFDVVLRWLDTVVPRVDAVAIDVRVLGVAAAIALLTGIAVGVAPAWVCTSAGAREALADAGRSVAGQRTGRRLRRAFIALEVALALVVIVSATLLGRSLVSLSQSPAGFVAEGLVTMHIFFEGRETDDTRAASARQLLAHLATVPGVAVVGGATGLPTVNAQRGTRFEIEGDGGTGKRRSAYFIPATPAYFQALGAPMRAGRAFQIADRAGAPPVAIVNETLARRLAPGGAIVGRRLRLINPEQSDTWRTIVGVVPDIRYAGMDDPGEAAIYTPFEQTPFPWVYVFVRTTTAPASMARTLSAAVGAFSPDLRPAQVTPMTTLVAEAVSSWAVNAVVVGSFALGAVLLAAVGIAGLVSYAVSQRHAELAIRQALGATPGALVWLAVREGLVPVAAGAVAGVGAALASARVMRGLLYGVTPADPLTFAASVLVVAIVALGAAWVPALRAARVTPVEALRLS